MKSFLALLVSLYFIVIPSMAHAIDQEKNEPEKISAEEAWKKVEGGALLIDVRSAEETASGTFGDAIHIPHESILQQLDKVGSDKNREIVLYCRSGRRSGAAGEELLSKGYKHVFNAGGFSELLAKKPVNRVLR